LVPILMSRLYVQFPSLFLSHTKYSHKKEQFTPKTEEILRYNRDNLISVTEHDMYSACMRAVSGNGLCQYAICMECYDKNKPKCNRGSEDKTVYHSNTEKHERCCQRLHNLEGRRGPWRCSRVFCHSEAWEGRISGCISYKREFLKVGGRG